MTGPDAGTWDERRVITAVFADLVGSTALGERLDPEELKLVVGEAIARIIAAIESFGGTIKDLAGDGVLALFGAPTAHEDDPERAVRAALRVRDEIEEYAREVERGWDVTGFGVRVGVSTGLVVVGEIGSGGRVDTRHSATRSTSRRDCRQRPRREPCWSLRRRSDWSSR